MSDDYDGTEDYNDRVRRDESNLLHFRRRITQQPDYRVENHGTIFLVHSNNAKALKWLRSHTDKQSAWLGTALAVEHRYISPLVDSLRDDGFSI